MTADGKLAGKRALVTGSGTGIGREIALEFARQGADVVLHYSKSARGAHSATEEIRAMGRRAAVFNADLSQVEACSDLVDKAVEFLGGIDILMNNAGITAATSFLDVKPEEFNLLYSVNIRGQFFCAQRAARCMLGQEHKGVIINMTSIHGCEGFVGHSVYDGTKGAIWAWTRELAVELAPLGIRVNGIAPGWIVVESHYRQVKNFDPPAVAKKMMVPWQRLGQPAEVARACVFLASEDSEYLVGHVLIIDGGATAKTSLPMELLESNWGDVSGD
jgi:NAD(P)-dependent dehydrogenase (short-subunit alcohol dehydrogenase family)